MLKSGKTGLLIVAGFFLCCAGPTRESTYRPAVPTQMEREWEAAHRQERSGNVDAAVAQYGVLCDREPPFVRACYDQCRGLFELSRVDAARTCGVAFAQAHADSALAPAMIKRIASSYRKQKQYLEGAQMLGAFALQNAKGDVWDSAVYQQASLLRSAGDRGAEETALLQIVKMGRWGSQLWDNAIWRVIQLQQEKGDVDREEKYLLEMLKSRETSRLIASYNSPYYDDGLFRLGELYREQSQNGKAYAAFRRLSGWKSSRLRDDALLQCAMIKKQANKVASACSHLEELLKRMPDSSSAHRAQSLLVEWKCVL